MGCVLWSVISIKMDVVFDPYMVTSLVAAKDVTLSSGVPAKCAFPPLFSSLPLLQNPIKKLLFSSTSGYSYYLFIIIRMIYLSVSHLE